MEKTNQSAIVHEAIERTRYAAQSVACGVDCQRCCMLPCGNGAAGHSISINRGAAIAAQTMLDESGLSLFV